jgi:phage tail sheath protein FI
MPFQVSPGIVVTERDLTTVVPNVATSIGALAGAFQWGPVLERQTITTENDLVRVFGEPKGDAKVIESFYVASNYLAYTNNLIIVRNVQDTARNSVVGDNNAGTASASTVVKNIDDYDSDISNLATGDVLFVAKYPGKLGDSLKVHAIDSHGWDATFTAGSAEETLQTKFKSAFERRPGTSRDVAKANGWDGVTFGAGVKVDEPNTNNNDEMHIMVVDEDGWFTGEPGEVLERHALVSKAIDAKKIDGSTNYVGNVLRTESQYVWLGDPVELTQLSTDSGAEVDAGQVKAGSVFKSMNSATESAKMPGGSLTQGFDGNNISNGEYFEAYDLFKEPEVVDVTLVMGGAGDTVVGRYIIDNITSVRKDCVALVSPNKASVVNPASNSAAVAALETDNTSLGSSSYAIMDGAWKYQYDRYNDVFRYIPMNGDIAGLCARTDFTHDAWWSPAGYNRGTIKNIVKLSWEANKANRDVMYQLGINPLITPRGAGVLLFGDKTMQVIPSAFDRINVRRLFIVLEKAIAIAAKSLLFEFNDEFTRAQFVNLVSPFLRDVQGRRGITDFKVVCDSSNNTGQVIDTNNFVGDIYIKPARSINFIQLNFIAARTDVSFSEIGG